MNQNLKQLLAGILVVLALAAIGYAVFSGKSGPTGKTISKLPPGFVREKDLETAQATKGQRPIPERINSDEDTLTKFIKTSFVPNDVPGVPGSVRNIFKYPPPPPPPPQKQEPPPPITIQGLSSSSFFGRTQMTNELVVRANPIPDGAQVYFDGVPAANQRRISPNEFKITLTPDMTSSPRPVSVKIMVPGQEAKLYSAALSFSIVEPPGPDFTFLGYLSDEGGKNPGAMIKRQNGEVRTVLQGQDLERFRFRTVTSEKIVVDDLQLTGVSHSIPIAGGRPSSGGGGPSGKF
jgi:hypothetical protein